MAATQTHPDDLVITAGDSLRWYQPDHNVAYGFCPRCGSSLFWRATDRPDGISIMAGSLDQPTGLQTTHAWWMAEHGDYHTQAPDLIEHHYED